jgi:hypothetical protein
MAFARMSDDPSLKSRERRQCLAKAEAYLAEAEDLARAAKTKEPEAYLKAARADVAHAKTKL